MRAVLCLFEGICTGAADGWARMTGRPAATLLHLGPGFANGIANLHNARRARTPVVNWIGDHATRHRAYDAPLASDIESLSASVGWTYTVGSAGEMSAASLAAVQAALGPPGRVASLIIPADCQWGAGPEPLAAAPLPAPGEPPLRAIQGAAHLLRKGRGGFAFPDIRPPYEMRSRLRATADAPPREQRAAHPDSLIALMNGPWEVVLPAQG